MAILAPLPASEIRKRFSHRGWFMACPVYVGGLDSVGLDLQERNGVPAWWFEVNAWAQSALITLLSAFDPAYEPQWMVLLTVPIAKDA